MYHDRVVKVDKLRTGGVLRCAFIENEESVQMRVALVCLSIPALMVLSAACACPRAPASSTARGCPPRRACKPCAAPERAPAKPPATDMVRVFEGWFLRGSPPGVGLEDERPQRKIWLSAFDIDRTETTVAQYDRCVKAGACAAPRCVSAKQQPERRPRHPVVCVPWKQAAAYCAWTGKRLPTEAEWEKAARGRSGRLYPWGNAAPSCELASYSGCKKPSSTLPVGSLPKGKSVYGALDMAGNVWEWVADWHHKAYYTTSPQRNPPGPFLGIKKVVRGGAFSYAADELNAHGRTFDTPDKAYNHVGIRCARSVIGDRNARKD
ncbi:MAG: SUMF1/EgtB/PvdO family nonheme iron enzyme [bacterium]